MSQTIQQKQVEYFTKYAGYCLKIWSSIVGQQITHYRHGPGTVVKIRKIKDGICVEVQFAEKPGEINFRLEKIVYYFSRVFTHLTLPREVEKELETDVTQFSRKFSISPQYLGSTGFDKPQDRELLRKVS